LIARVASGVGIPVFGSGDCIEPGQLVDRMRGGGGVSGVLVGRGALRNPWIFQQARDVAEGRPPREVSAGERARFLLEYIDLLVSERIDEAAGFRHTAPGQASDQPARGRERWVINKLRALNSWYTKGLDNGSHLRVSINAAESIPQLREIIESFFKEPSLSAER
jgi:tRNA-dihydrouridine synthase